MVKIKSALKKAPTDNLIENMHTNLADLCAYFWAVARIAGFLVVTAARNLWTYVVVSWVTCCG